MLLGTRSRDIASSATTIARHARPRRGVAMSIADSAEIGTGRTISRIASTVRFVHRLGHFHPVCREDGSRLLQKGVLLAAGKLCYSRLSNYGHGSGGETRSSQPHE